MLRKNLLLTNSKLQIRNTTSSLHSSNQIILINYTLLPLVIMWTCSTVVFHVSSCSPCLMSIINIITRYDPTTRMCKRSPSCRVDPGQRSILQLITFTSNLPCSDFISWLQPNYCMLNLLLRSNFFLPWSQTTHELSSLLSLPMTTLVYGSFKVHTLSGRFPIRSLSFHARGGYVVRRLSYSQTLDLRKVSARLECLACILHGG